MRIHDTLIVIGPTAAVKKYARRKQEGRSGGGGWYGEKRLEGAIAARAIGQVGQKFIIVFPASFTNTKCYMIV